MIRSLWIAKTGLDAQQTQLDVITNNLANVNTTGFKKSRAVFEDLLYQTLRQPGAQSSQQTTVPSGLQIGLGTKPVATERIHTQGNLSQTGNALDVAIQGQGFFQVQMPDGTLAYTRDGSFQKDANGQLVTSSGYPLAPPVQVQSDVLSVTISRDGEVSVLRSGQTAPQAAGNIQLTTFVNPGGLQSMGENLYAETASSGAPLQGVAGSDGLGTIKQGMLETSNVNVTEELVNLIQAQRVYEMNSKVLSTVDEMMSFLTQRT